MSRVSSVSTVALAAMFLAACLVGSAAAHPGHWQPVVTAQGGEIAGFHAPDGDAIVKAGKKERKAKRQAKRAARKAKRAAKKAQRKAAGTAG